MHHLALRVSLPDRPGALSALTAAIGDVAADIVSLEVVGRKGGTAVDDLCVDSPVGPHDLRAALESVPGVVVEAVRGVDAFPDPGAAVSLAARLTAAGGVGAAEGHDERLRALLEGLPAALWSTWAAAVRLTSDRGLQVLGGAHGVPDLDGGRAPWLPLDAPRTIEIGPWLPAEEQEPARRCRLEVAVAPLGEPRAAVVLARVGGPSFRDRELHVLGQLARIAAAASEGLPRRSRAGEGSRVMAAGRSDAGAGVRSTACPPTASPSSTPRS